MIKFCFSLLVFLNSISVFSYAKERHMLFYTKEDAISPSAVGFYSKVDGLIRSEFYIVENIEKESKWNFLERDKFVESHPHADADNERSYESYANHKKSSYYQVQEMLENNAVNFAIIVDCKADGLDKVSSCGLYYYSRESQKVVASTNRIFSVSISKPGSWAGQMVDNFTRGLNSIREKENQKIIDKLSIRDDEKDEYLAKGKWIEYFALVGTTKAGKETIPGFAIAFELGTHNIKFAADYSLFYKRSQHPNLGMRKIKDHQIHVGIIASSNKIRNIIWEGGFKIGVASNKSSDNNGPNEFQNVLLSIQPGFRIPMGSGFVTLRTSFSWSADIRNERGAKDENYVVTRHVGLGYMQRL